MVISISNRNYPAMLVVFISTESEPGRFWEKRKYVHLIKLIGLTAAADSDSSFSSSSLAMHFVVSDLLLIWFTSGGTASFA